MRAGRSRSLHRARAVAAAGVVVALVPLAAAGCGRDDAATVRQAAAANAEEIEHLERRVGALERQLRGLRRDLRASSPGQARAGAAPGGQGGGTAAPGGTAEGEEAAPGGAAPQTEAQTCGPDTSARC